MLKLDLSFEAAGMIDRILRIDDRRLAVVDLHDLVGGRGETLEFV